jgi:hypothetical protein
MQHFITDIEEDILKRCVEFYTKLSEYIVPLFFINIYRCQKLFPRLVNGCVISGKEGRETNTGVKH